MIKVDLQDRYQVSPKMSLSSWLATHSNSWQCMMAPHMLGARTLKFSLLQKFSCSQCQESAKNTKHRKNHHLIIVNIAKVKCPEFLSFPHSYLNITPRFKIKADLEEARIEEEERLKVMDRWEQGSIKIDGEKMHLLLRLQIPWWKQSLQRWNRELKKKRWDAMYL